LSVNGRHREKVLTVGIDGKVIFKETAGDVDPST
jgi:hypothetical protein